MLWVTMAIVYVPLQLHHQLLDLVGGDRVERRARLVHQEHLGLARPGSGRCTGAAAGRRRARPRRPSACPSPRPRGRPAQAALHRSRPGPARAGGPGQLQPGDHVVVDRHQREGVGLLEDHPDVAAAPAPGRPCGRRCPARPAAPCPSTRLAPGVTSCIRFRQRMKVLLPQPEGPIRAVTALGLDRHVDVGDGLVARRSRRETSCAPASGARPSAAAASAPTWLAARRP